jgi:WD40 repeat protein
MFVKKDLLKYTFTQYQLPERLNLSKIIKNNLLLSTSLSLDTLVREKLTLFGHEELVLCLINLPEGMIASCSVDCTIRIWNKSFQCEKVIKGHDDVINCILSLPNGNIASGSGDTTIRIWNKSKDFELAQILGHTGIVYCLLLLPNGNIVSGGFDNTIRVWECADNQFECKIILKDHTDKINGFLLLEGGQFVSTSFDSTARIWSCDYKCIQIIQNKIILKYLVQTRSGKILSSGWVDNKIVILENFKHAKTLDGHKRLAFVSALLSDNFLISASHDSIILWDESYQFKRIQTIVKSERTLALIVLPSGDFATCGNDMNIKIWGI